MAITKKKNWEVVKVEYENALAQYRHYASLRRQDMIFATTVQAAVLTIIGRNLLALDAASFLLSVVAFIALSVAFNAERRLTAYMKGFMLRATQIESDYDMSFLALGDSEVKKKRWLISNTVMFPLYHFIFLIAWLVIWVLNLARITFVR